MEELLPIYEVDENLSIDIDEELSNGQGDDE